MSASRITLMLALMALPWSVDPSAAQEAGRLRGLDSNGDGVITRSEWRGSARAFRQMDWNNDGVLSGDELAGGQRQWTGRTVEQLDRNDNGRVEFAEWQGTRAEFNRLDRNRDGALTRRELNRDDVASASFEDEFSELDYNGNGVIAFGEWPRSRAQFEQYDLNNDGVITRREYDASDTAGRDDTVGANEVRDVRVDPRDRWTATGLHVRAGELVMWQASGTITMSSGTDTATPAGSTAGRHAPNAPIREASAGGLLMKVGDSVVRFAGASGSFRATTSGEIFLGVNDDHLADNGGEYRVTVSIGR